MKVFNIIKLFIQNFRVKFQGIHERYPQYEIGRGTYGNLTVLPRGTRSTLKIGAFCSIADGVKIFMAGGHRPEWVSTYPFNALWLDDPAKGYPRGSDVTIGNDVWLCTDCVIMPGITIGDGAVVGARAVVTRDVEPYTIVAGNPAHLVKKRFDDKTIQQLLELKWWTLKDEDIKKLLPLMTNKDIQAFIRVAGNYEP